jgi:phosphatidylserine decarboxylase
MMNIRREVLPCIGIVAAVGACAGILLHALMVGVSLFLSGTACLLFFFRDPERTPPPDTTAILSGADGRVTSVTRLVENRYLNVECVRISVFLSIFDVHVNRSPLSGYAKFIGYFPGKKIFAFREKASEFNQHNKILIEGPQTRCLVAQIAGPVARRVVYWLDRETPVPVKAGDRIGMMKFGSRLDIYLPADDVDVLAKRGDRVRAGETVIARIKAIERKLSEISL